jgi:DNA-directed RNA polymerase subunit beta
LSPSFTVHPGIAFEVAPHPNGKLLHSFRIIPDRGTWLEVQFDNNDLLYVYLDRRRRRRKFLITTLLRAVGYSADIDILNLFYEIQELKVSKALDMENVSTLVLVEDAIDAQQGVVLARAFEPLTKAIVRTFEKHDINSIRVIDTAADEGAIIRALKKDPTRNEEEALKEIYKRLRPGEPPTTANAKALLKRLFFDPKRYDLGRVGRYKVNQKLGLKVDLEQRILEAGDVVGATKYLVRLKRGEGVVDDIDHLGSRRVRTVGELLANQCRVGLARTERSGTRTHDDVRPERRLDHTPEADQSEGAHDGHPRLLRAFAAVAVHGSDQSARRGDAQAPPVGSRTRGSEPRSCRLRGPRRASLALRPYLPD